MKIVDVSIVPQIGVQLTSVDQQRLENRIVHQQWSWKYPNLPEPDFSGCLHPRCNIDGICLSCGEDCRGIH